MAAKSGFPFFLTTLYDTYLQSTQCNILEIIVNAPGAINMIKFEIPDLWISLHVGKD